jgi:uncharacterized protein YdiU (UPF0061 family)
MRAKLGLGAHPAGADAARAGDASDDALVDDLLGRMADNAADFTLTFRRLCDAVEETPVGDDSVAALFDDPGAFEPWALRWRSRLALEGRTPSQSRSNMRAVNPAYIARNHLVEEVIVAAVEGRDLAPFERLVEVLSAPFTDQPGRARYAAPPRPDQVVRETFCGT